MSWHLKTILSLSVFLILFGSCGNKRQAPISEETMTAILFDLQAAEAYSMGRFEGEDAHKNANVKNQDTLAKLYAMILTKYDLSQGELEEALNWYMRNTEDLDLMYDKVVDTANYYKNKFLVKDINLEDSNAVADTNRVNPDTVNASELLPNNRPRVAPGIESLRPVKEDDYRNAADEKLEKDAIKKSNKQMKETLDKVKKEN